MTLDLSLTDASLKGCTKLSSAVLDRDRPAVNSIIAKKKYDINEADKHGRLRQPLTSPTCLTSVQNCAPLRLC